MKLKQLTQVPLTAAEVAALPFQYLEVAPSSALVGRKAGRSTYATDTSVFTKIGQGEENTKKIVSRSTEGARDNAFVYADLLSFGSQSDWFLPSQDEAFLIKILNTRNSPSIGNFNSRITIWTSMTHGGALISVMLTSNYYRLNYPFDTNDVMPIRAFGETGNPATTTTVAPITTVAPASTTATTTSATTALNATTTTIRATTTTVRLNSATVAPATTTAPTTTAATTTTVAPTTTLKTCANGGACSLGDTGPGGGTVYYVSTSTFTCGETLASSCKYLEFSPKSWKVATPTTANCESVDTNNVNCVLGLPDSSASSSGAIGQGWKNSKELIDKSGALNSWAPVVSRAYQGGGKSDWFLPSQKELDELCKYANGGATGGTGRCSPGTLADSFKAGLYWSAHDGGGGDGIAIDFGTGQQSFLPKTAKYLVRPIRAF